MASLMQQTWTWANSGSGEGQRGMESQSWTLLTEQQSHFYAEYLQAHWKNVVVFFWSTLIYNIILVLGVQHSDYFYRLYSIKSYYKITTIILCATQVIFVAYLFYHTTFYFLIWYPYLALPFFPFSTVTTSIFCISVSICCIH